MSTNKNISNTYLPDIQPLKHKIRTQDEICQLLERIGAIYAFRAATHTKTSARVSRKITHFPSENKIRVCKRFKLFITSIIIIIINVNTIIT